MTERTDGDASDRAPESLRLLFVCTGNTCRSPLAEVLAREAAAARGWTGVEVRSAGVAAGAGMPASEGSLRAAARHDLDLSSHRSRPLSPDLLAWADLVLTMSPGHLSAIGTHSNLPHAFVITDFAQPEGAAGDHEGVADPIGGSDAEYEATFIQLRDLVERTLDRLSEGRSS